jgi:hypothetical protein
MDILPISNLMQIVKASRHEDQQPQKRQQPRKKDNSGSRMVYTPDGHLEEEPPSKIDVIA